MAMAQQFPHGGAIPGHGGMQHGHPGGPGHPQGMPGGQSGMNPMHMAMGGGPGGSQVTQAGMIAGMPSMNPNMMNQLQMQQALASQNAGMPQGFMNNPALSQQALMRQQQQLRMYTQNLQNPNMMMPGAAHAMPVMPNGIQGPMPRAVSMPGHMPSPMPQAGHPQGQPNAQMILQQQQQQQAQQQQQQQVNIAAAQQAAAAEQQRQQQAQQQQHQQQAQQQAQQQQQQQQIAMQQASQSGPSPAPSAPNHPPMRPPSQVQNRPEQQDASQTPGQPQPPQQQPTPVQQPQPAPPQAQIGQQQGQTQAQGQNAGQNQGPPQIGGPQGQNQTPAQQAELAQRRAAMMQQRNAMMGQVPGSCILTLLQFADLLSVSGADMRGDELAYWQVFVSRFFASNGQMRQHLQSSKDPSYKKGFTVAQASLAWYFYLLFRHGIVRIDINIHGAAEEELPTPLGGHIVKSKRTSFTYWHGPSHQVVLTGKLNVIFDAQGKIQLFDYEVEENKEYIDRSELVDGADLTGSPNMSKNSKRAIQQRASSIAKNPGLLTALERRPVGEFSLNERVMVFLEFADNFGTMRHLIEFSAQNQGLSVQDSLRQVVANFSQQNTGQNADQANNVGSSGPHGGFPGMPPNQRTPGAGSGTAFASPVPGSHLSLPGGMAASPAMMNHGLPGGQGGVAMMQNASQGGGSGNPSASASPNVAGKKRTASQVKQEEGPDVGVQGPGAKGKVTPSPRIGGKRMKS